jgi:outer membrane protein TolC
VRLGWLERRIALAETQLIEESQTSDRLKEAYDEGDITADQLGVQIAAQESIRTNLVTLEQARIESRSALLALLGQPDTTELAVEAPDPEIIDALPTPMQVIPTCLARRLDLEALRRGYAAADARLWQSVLDQFPNVTVGFAAQRNESKLKFLGGFVSLGIPIFDWNQAAVARSKATRERLGLEYAARAAEVRNVVRGGLALLEMVSLRLPEIAASIEPLELIETDESSAAKSGDVDWLSYVTIRLALLDQRLQKAALSQLAAETRIGLETACGRPGWPLELAGGSD